MTIIGSHFLGAGRDGPTEREAARGGGGEVDGPNLGDAQEPLHLLQWVKGGRPGRGDDHGVGVGDVVGGEGHQLCLGVKFIFSQVLLVKNSGTVIVLKNSSDFNSLADLI